MTTGRINQVTTVQNNAKESIKTHLTLLHNQCTRMYKAWSKFCNTGSQCSILTSQKLSEDSLLLLQSPHLFRPWTFFSASEVWRSWNSYVVVSISPFNGLSVQTIRLLPTESRLCIEWPTKAPAIMQYSVHPHTNKVSFYVYQSGKHTDSSLQPHCTRNEPNGSQRFWTKPTMREVVPAITFPRTQISTLQTAGLCL